MMSQVFKFLFGRDLEPDSPFLSTRDRRKLINRRNKGAYICPKGNLPVDAKPHALILGASGSGKTSAYIIPSLLSMKANRSCVVFDPGGDVATKTVGYLQEEGFTVKTLDFEHHDISEHFNPLLRATDPMSIQKVADILVDVNYQGSNISDPFWPDSAKLILKIFLQAILNEEQKSKPKTLLTLYSLLNQFGTEQQDLDEFIMNNVPHEVELEYLGFVQNSNEKTQEAILQTCKTAISKVTTLGSLISDETLHFEALRTTPTVLFIKVREDQIKFYNFIISIFYAQLFDMLMELPNGDTTYLGVTILADEFTCYRVPNVENLITVLRRRKVYLAIILQSLSQLEVYGKHPADTIIANCSTLLVFPGIGDTTAKRIEYMLGDYGSQRVMASREIRMMKQNEVLFIHSNYSPKVITMKPYFKVRKFKRRVNLPVDQEGGSA